MASFIHLKRKRIFQLLGLIISVGFICLILYPDFNDSRSRTISSNSRHSHFLAVVIPFRDRFEELLEFVPYIHSFLNEQQVEHVIIVVNQADALRFNRGALINIGFLFGESHGCDYMVMHDIDLLPMNHNLIYKFNEDSVHHIAAPELHPLYHYAKFLGGILIINNRHYKLVNGMTNKFWGWGREDDEFYLRLSSHNINIIRPTNINTGLKTFKHLHNKFRRKRDNIRYGSQKINTRRDYETGVNSVNFTTSANYTLSVNGIVAYVYNVHLLCDLKVTPWCMSTSQIFEYLKVMNGTVSRQEYNALVSSLRTHKMIL